jgi:hypothetical protein
VYYDENLLGKRVENTTPEHTPVLSVLNYRKSQRRRKWDETTLLALLAAFNNRQCVDSRDTVLALLGMASNCQDSKLNADYAKPLFAVYSDMFSLSQYSGIVHPYY